jgi:hypothetical protein
MAENTAQQIEQQQREWIDAWSKKMIQIWQDKLSYWNIRRTGTLMGSFQEAVNHNGLSANILMRFLSYGIYQAYGTGREFSSKEKGNHGDLRFLDPAYRREHRLDVPRKVGPAWGGYYTSGDPRKRRDWFNPKLFGSMMRLRETMARMIGEEGAAVICEALENPRAALK